MKKTILLAILFPFFLMPFVAVAQGHPTAIIVNASNPLETVSLRDLVQVFRQEKQFWPNGRKIVVVMRGADEESAEKILRQVYKMSEEDLRRYWVQKLFQGEIAEPPKTLHSSASVKAYVAAVPQAVGFVDLSETDGSVKVLKIDGKLPGEEGYPLP